MVLAETNAWTALSSILCPATISSVIPSQSHCFIRNLPGWFAQRAEAIYNPDWLPGGQAADFSRPSSMISSETGFSDSLRIGSIG